MLKFIVATLALSSISFAASSGKISDSSAEEVEMEMTAESRIIVLRARPDAALYVLSEGQYSSPALVEAMNVMREEKGQAVQATDLDLALEILNTK